MKVTYYNTQSILFISCTQLKKFTRHFLQYYKVICDEVIYHFVNKKTISRLHKKYFKNPSPTDCISFPIDSPSKQPCGSTQILGELFVCPEIALEYSHANHIDPYLELSYYIVHGLLHLLGYDDTDPQNEKTMREEEQRCLSYLEEQKALLKA